MFWPTSKERKLYKDVTDKSALPTLVFRFPLHWFIKGWRGLTLPFVVLLDTDFNRDERPDLMVHELVHVSQYWHNLIVFFYLRYILSSSFRKKVEDEAYEVQDDAKWVLGLLFEND